LTGRQRANTSLQNLASPVHTDCPQRGGSHNAKRGGAARGAAAWAGGPRVGSDPSVLRGGWWRENMPGPGVAGAGHLARLFNGAPRSTGAHCGRPGFGPNGHSRQVRERTVKSRGRHAQRAGREAHIKPGPQGRAGLGAKRQTRRSRVGWDGAARNGRHAGVGVWSRSMRPSQTSQTSEAAKHEKRQLLFGASARDHPNSSAIQSLTIMYTIYDNMYIIVTI